MRKLICAIIALISISVSAKVKLPSFFCDNMVLQQQSECNIWGWAEPGTRICITTSWDKKGHNVMANKYGHFGLKVKTPEAGGPYFIGFKDKDYVQLSNVMIGEVWICAGQSNMDMQLKGYKGQPVEGATEELLNCNDSDLRLLFVKRQAELTPQDDIKGGTWKVANAASVRDFSAAAYYFGKALRHTLGVPVGLICTAYGGSACEAWMKSDWLRAFPQVQQTITAEDVNNKKQRCPTALYNGQLYPLIGYGIRGAIWYQGEDNIPRYDYYAPLLKTMVEGWRSEWKQGEFPFYFCQIAPFDYSLIQWKNSQYLREQQLKAESIIPHARMAVLMDAGLEYGIHPRKKREAGENRVFYPAQAWTSRNKVYVKSESIYDAFRQKKTAFWMFASQENHEPMVHIAHEMTQFSDADVIVYSNCDSVRLSRCPHAAARSYAFISMKWVKNWWPTVLISSLSSAR